MLSRILTFAGAMTLAPALLAESTSVSIENAWVRALPPVQQTTAAYLTLNNSGATPLRVVGATVAGAGKVEIHISREVDGLVRMEQLTTLEVAPQATYALAPGGTHLMLFELEAMPQPGESRTLCIEFAEAAAVCTEAEVRKGAPAQADHHHHH